jgi:hypothetical protein
VEHLPPKRLLSGKGWGVGARQATGSHDQPARGRLLPVAGPEAPEAGSLVEDRSLDAGGELDVAPEIEAVGDVVQIAEDLGLAGVALGPLPRLLELGREAVGIFETFDVAARARIAVPVPRAAHAVGGLIHVRLQPEAAQPV